MTGPAPSVSVVIPTLNEEPSIQALLNHVQGLGAAEIVIADGGSVDRTVAIAEECARVVSCQANRGLQLNAGAAAASGDVLLFLHADVRLENGAIGRVQTAMTDPAIVGGDFDIRYDGGDFASRAFTAVNRLRRYFHVIYGDSGIFCRRSVFERLGGFRPYPVLEDYEFVRRLRRCGKLALLDEPIHVSDRRWRRSGLFHTMWVWFWIQGLYLAGVKPDRLARWYRPVR